MSDFITKLSELIDPEVMGDMAVSYTHLDVYKRQVQRGAAAGGTVVLKARESPTTRGASADANGHGAVKTAPYKAPVYGRT